MKRILYIIIIIIVSVNTFAQNKSMTDTVYSIKEVEILGASKKKVEIGKLNVPLQYLPMSVSTVSYKDLEIRGISNIEDLSLIHI